MAGVSDYPTASKAASVGNGKTYIGMNAGSGCCENTENHDNLCLVRRSLQVSCECKNKYGPGYTK